MQSPRPFATLRLGATSTMTEPSGMRGARGASDAVNAGSTDDDDERLAALRRAQAGAQARARPGDTRRWRRLRAHTCTPERRPRMSTHALPYAHLGDALATDYFQVRNQFT